MPSQHLPRLKPGQKPSKPKTRVVDLPGVGASVVIGQPSTKQFVELQEGATGLSELEQARAIVMLAIVEPEMTADDLRAAMEEWPIGDWLTLQQAVLEHTGLGDAAAKALQASFREG